MLENIKTCIGQLEEKTGRIQTEGCNSNKEVEKFYNKLVELGINLEELKPFLEADGTVLTIAGAGGGKTTAIVLKVIKGFVDGSFYKEIVTENGIVRKPKRILVSTYLSSGKKDMERVFNNWCKKLGVVIPKNAVQFNTLHAEFLKTLQYMYIDVTNNKKATLNILSNKERDSIIREIMQKYKIRSVTQKFQRSTLSNEEITEMGNLIGYINNQIDTNYYHPSLKDFNITKNEMKYVMNEYTAIKTKLNKIDYDDMQRIIYEVLQLKNEKSKKLEEYIKELYDVIIEDEFQDTSTLQYKLLQYYLKETEMVVVVGDDDQCIYTWRGSNVDIMTKEFVKDYNPTLVKLSTNYRCKSNILNFVKPSIESNTNRHTKELKSYNTGGIVKILKGTTLPVFLESLQEGRKYGTIGILGRTNSDLVIPAIMLELFGLDYTISSHVTMKTRLYTDITDVFSLFTQRVPNNLEHILNMFVPPYKKVEVKNIVGVLANNKDIDIFTIPLKDVKYSSPSIYGVIEQLQKIKQIETDEKKQVIRFLLYMYKVLYADKSNSYIRRQKQFLLFLVNVLKSKLLEEQELRQIEKLFTKVIPYMVDMRKAEDESPIRLTTVHDSKGKEWNSVFIWNDVNGSFPSTQGIITQQENEEERRLHYIACTRAKDYLVICTQEDNMSPYLNECDMRYVTTQDKADEEVLEEVSMCVHDRVTDYFNKLKVIDKVNNRDEEVANIYLMQLKVKTEEEYKKEVEEQIENFKKSGGIIDFTTDNFIRNAILNTIY